MRKTASIALTLLLLTGGIASAGVVVDEQQVSDRGAGAPVTHKITVMVQGNKQKSIIDDGKQSLVTNLDNGTRMMISSERKMYVEMPFPSKGMPVMQDAGKGLDFKKTGEHHTIAGYPCDDYLGTGTMGGNQMTVRGCFSTAAPGAAEFNAFQKAMAAKVKGTPMAMMASAPAGVPLQIDTSMKVTHMMVPGMTPQQAEEFNKRLANRPPVVTHMTVSKISTRQLAANTFTPPAGYTKQSMPMMGGGMAGHPSPPIGGKPMPMMPPSSPAASSTKVPE